MTYAIPLECSSNRAVSGKSRARTLAGPHSGSKHNRGEGTASPTFVGGGGGGGRGERLRDEPKGPLRGRLTRATKGYADLFFFVVVFFFCRAGKIG